MFFFFLLHSSALFLSSVSAAFSRRYLYGAFNGWLPAGTFFLKDLSSSSYHVLVSWQRCVRAQRPSYLKWLFKMWNRGIPCFIYVTGVYGTVCTVRACLLLAVLVRWKRLPCLYVNVFSPFLSACLVAHEITLF